MKQPKTIDRSLTERHRIMTLLSRVGEESVTLEEMEKIGTTLQQSGPRALSPLVRRLWREKNGDVISRYAYLLDFFADDTWVDQLVQIALRRKDLEEEGKLALLAVLEGCGIDVAAPPFDELFVPGLPVQKSLPFLLDRGEEGLVIFIEELLVQPLEERKARISELASVKDHRVLMLLEILLEIDLGDVPLEVVATLGRIRSREAATVLDRICEKATGELLRHAERSRRRLAFVGVIPGETKPAAQPLPLTAASVSPIDGAGYLVIWLCRPNGKGSNVVVYLRVHETMGIHSVWGASSLPDQDAEKHQQALSCEEGAVPVSPEYALLLLRDAVHRGYRRNPLLPAEFYVWRRFFLPEEVAPLPYTPRLPGLELVTAAARARLTADGGSLFEDDFFAGWILANHRVYDYAEEWLATEQERQGKARTKGVEDIVRRFCLELLEPDMERLRQRLLLTADLMMRAGKERDLVEKAIVVAASLALSGVPSHRHPFLRRFALESMDMAREALAEGFDLRLQPDSGMDDDWE